MFESSKQCASAMFGGISAIVLAGCAVPAESTPEEANVNVDEVEVVAPQNVDYVGRPLGPITDRAVRLNPSVSQELMLVARLEVQRNEMLEFYRPASRRGVLVSGTGAPEGGMLVQPWDRRTIGELWTAYAAGAELPAELREVAAMPLTAMRDQGAQTQPQVTEAGVGGALGLRDKATGGWCSSGYFAANPCPGGDVQDCLNWWGGGRAFGCDDVEYGYSSVCPTNGPVTLRVKVPTEWSATWTVAQDTDHWAKWSDWNCGFIWLDCEDFHSYVEQATNRVFQWRASCYQ